MIHLRFILMSLLLAGSLSAASGLTYDPYGGVMEIPGSKATGFFHLEKIGGRHFLITPAGHAFFSIG